MYGHALIASKEKVDQDAAERLDDNELDGFLAQAREFGDRLLG